MTDSELIEKLRPFLTEKRMETLETMLAKRTKHMTVVLENIFHSHNSSAVMRTCECFGIQDLHVIENNNQFTIHPDIVRGATKWLNINRYCNATDNTPLCIDALKRDGYRIVVTSPHGEGVTNLEDFDVTKGKFAIMMGSEKVGISDYAWEHADERLTIPMCGFTESLNISVSTAIILHTLRVKMDALGVESDFPEEEKRTTLLHWMVESIASGKEVLRRILEQELD